MVFLILQTSQRPGFEPSTDFKTDATILRRNLQDAKSTRFGFSVISCGVDSRFRSAAIAQEHLVDDQR
jgi:hypothetical protein